MIKLKKISIKDVNKTYLKWMNDKKVFKYTDQSKTNHSIRSIKKYVKDRLNSNEIIYGIFYSNKHIGNIKLGPIDYLNKTSEISYFIGEKNFWNKGIGFLAIKKVIKVAKKMKLKKITAGCVESNKSSQIVLEKNNFKIEGKLKSQIIIKKKRMTNFVYGLQIK